MAQAGYAVEVKALLTKYGAAKLADIDPSQYPALLLEAEALKKPEVNNNG